MDIKKEIKSCFHDCPFHNKSMDGIECGHPYFKDKGAYENMTVITQENRMNKIPEKCPLKKEQLVITYELHTTAQGRH